MENTDKREIKDNVFKVLNDAGEEVECRVLFTFDSDETGKSYIIYTDDKVGEDGRTLAYASIFDPTGNNDELTPITDEKEWDLVFSVYESLEKKEKDKETDEE